MADEVDSTCAASGGESDPAAIALAFGAASHSERVASRAEAYLENQARLSNKQSVLVDLQSEDLRHELKLNHWSARIHHASAILKLGFEVAIAFIVLALAVLLGGAIWDAAHDHGLVVESFSVPPDLAARGLTGEVIATRLLDRLSALQAQTNSSRAPSSYANNWGSDIKVQIPDTGVSIGEFNRFLHAWLGHQTRISGDIYRTAAGIAITARAGSATSPTFTGPDSDLDRLIQKAAESVYRATQPYRYAAYLAEAGRATEAEAAYEALIANGSPADRPWALVGLGSLYETRGDLGRALALFRRSLELRPGFVLADSDILDVELQYQHDEGALATERELVRLSEGPHDSDISNVAWSFGPLLSQAGLAAALGDFGAELKANAEVETRPEFQGFVENARLADLRARADLHDAQGLRAEYADLPPSNDPRILLPREGTFLSGEALLGDPTPFLREAAKFTAVLRKSGATGILILQRRAWPIEAYGMALLGHSADSHGLIDQTPADCTICLRMRGRIDSMEKNWAGADYWFGRAARFAPSPPFAWTDWGAMLLAKGDTDGAIAKFALAHAKGPHFADPLEMWGEALIAKNRSDLALAKFEEANRYAPNWGRLHLEWGKALLWTGDKAGAKRQFEIASRLDLNAADSASLRNERASL